MVATKAQSKVTHKDWPRRVRVGREEVTVYRRKSGYFQVVNYDHDGRRRLESCSTEADALERAEQIAIRLNEANVTAASMTRDEAIEYTNAVQILKPLGVSMIGAATTVAECLKFVSGLIDLGTAVREYSRSHRETTAKRVSAVVAEMLEVKARDMSSAYVGDLRSRHTKFAADFERDTCNITTAEIQAWLDGKRKLGSQSRANYKRVLYTFFAFAMARGYASENPAKGMDPIKVRNGEIGIFTPLEIARLLSAASVDFLPVLAIGAIAGLRSAEMERLEWSDIQLTEKIIVVGKDKAKTASRRTVPITDNLGEWLRPYANCSGLVWKGMHEQFYESQQQTAAATGVENDVATNTAAVKPVRWKANALRHSFISYRLADIKNAAQVALEAGNSPSVINGHFKDGLAPIWFGATNFAVVNDGTNADILSSTTGFVFVPQSPEVFGYDADGDVTNDGWWTFTWDAANRLVSVVSLTSSPAASKRRLTFGYDYQGRRISKTVESWTGSSWLATASNKFVYDGWNLLAELNATNNAIIRSYVWGLEQGAGGVGGLLAMTNAANGTHFAACDGNGNVKASANANDGTTSANYEYGPFGETLRATGLMASANPFRFSTKHQDNSYERINYPDGFEEEENSLSLSFQGAVVNVVETHFGTDLTVDLKVAGPLTFRELYRTYSSGSGKWGTGFQSLKSEQSLKTNRTYLIRFSIQNTRQLHAIQAGFLGAGNDDQSGVVFFQAVNKHDERNLTDSLNCTWTNESYSVTNMTLAVPPALYPLQIPFSPNHDSNVVSGTTIGLDYGTSVQVQAKFNWYFKRRQ